MATKQSERLCSEHLECVRIQRRPALVDAVARLILASLLGIAVVAAAVKGSGVIPITLLASALWGRTVVARRGRT